MNILKKFASGGFLPRSDNKDKVSVILSRGWWMCKKCGKVYESDAPILNQFIHKCEKDEKKD